MTLTSLVTVQSNIHPGPNLPGQVTTNAAGQADAGLPVALGGRIVQASRNGKGIVIVAEHLPIVNHPVDGPTEDVKRTGDYEFAFLYPGELEPQDLRNGNRFVMVGTTTSRRPVVVNGVPKTEPFLIADCIHVWQTGRAEIAEFKEDVGGGFSPLPKRRTVSVSSRGNSESSDQNSFLLKRGDYERKRVV